MTSSINAKSFYFFTDEAPDTGDDSDEDLITSYLGGAGSNLGGNSGTGDSLIPTIQVTPHSPNANRILGMSFAFNTFFG